MPQIEITGESDQNAGWRFDCQVLDDAGSLHPLTLTLSWADYNHWSPDGSDSPQQVAEAVLAFLLMKLPPSELQSSFDASRARARFADADETIPTLIAR